MQIFTKEFRGAFENAVAYSLHGTDLFGFLADAGQMSREEKHEMQLPRITRPRALGGDTKLNA